MANADSNCSSRSATNRLNSVPRLIIVDLAACGANTGSTLIFGGGDEGHIIASRTKRLPDGHDPGGVIAVVIGE